MLRFRLLSATVLVGCVVLFFWLDAVRPLLTHPGLWLLPILLFFAGTTAWEFGQLLKKRWKVQPLFLAAGTLTVVLAASIPMIYPLFTGRLYPPNCPVGFLGWPLISILVVCSLFGIVAMRRLSETGDQAIELWALSSLVVLYTGGCGSFAIPIRLFGSDLFGLMAFVGLIAVTKASDIGAYFVGRFFGRNKLSPKISPNKTVEGAVGGIVASILVAECLFRWTIPSWIRDPSYTYPAWFGPAVAGTMLAIVGMFGDLLESSVKRSVGVKDSGQWLPGMGGIWDVTDSMLPALVVGYLGLIGGLLGGSTGQP